MYTNEKSSEDLRAKCKAALKQTLQKCLHIEALEPLLHDAPPNILKYVLGQFSKVSCSPHDKWFVIFFYYYFFSSRDCFFLIFPIIYT